MFDPDAGMPRINRGMVYLGACLIAGIRLARERQVNVRVVPTSRAIEESVDLARFTIGCFGKSRGGYRETEDNEGQVSSSRFRGRSLNQSLPVNRGLFSRRRFIHIQVHPLLKSGAWTAQQLFASSRVIAVDRPSRHGYSNAVPIPC
jgi:hypothetical protein